MNHAQVIATSSFDSYLLADIERKRSELAKALKCYRAVAELSSKIDPALVEEANRGIYQIEALQASQS